MSERFTPVAFDDIREEVKQHLASLPGRIESFLEDYILTSNHYRIMADGEPAGFASIHGKSLITQFALTDRYKRLGQPFFLRLRKMEQVQSAFVPTCDEFFLAHALDDYRELLKQAYFFMAAEVQSMVLADGYRLQLAELGDAEFIREQTGDFFENVEQNLTKQKLFLTTQLGRPVGFGILEVNSLYEHTASIGMFTIEAERGRGVGTATIALLMDECRRCGLHASAGCWYYNHLSKQTLEQAGVISRTRLLRVNY